MTSPVDLVLQHVKLPFEKLHSYQVEDINRLAPEPSCGLFLDLGLGKTVVSIIIGVYKLLTAEFFSCHVLCPESLITQWVSTLEKMGLKVLAYRGTPTQRSKMDLDYDFVVMSYQIFQKDYARLKDTNAYYIIDEATVMCHTNNLIYKMLQGGTVEKKKKVPGKLKPEIIKTVYEKSHRGMALLSATPVNKPEDSYGLLSILVPEAYRNYTFFSRMHIVKYNYFNQPEEYANLDTIRDYLLKRGTQRLASDHIDLPPIIFKTVEYELSKPHLKLYYKLIEERVLEHEGEIVVNALQASALYNWSQKIILNPEVAVEFKGEPAGLEILDGFVKSVPKGIIFGNYRMTNGKLQERYKCGACYGDISSALKDKYLHDFKNGSLDWMLAHCRSAGVGHDLPMCQHIFFPELPITPRDLRQAVGRCWRQGQEKTVIVTVMVAKGTIQETLLHRLLDKDDLMAEVIATPSVLREDLLGNITKVDSKIKIKDIMKELRGEV